MNIQNWTNPIFAEFGGIEMDSKKAVKNVPFWTAQVRPNHKLLSNGADPNIATQNGMTPLICLYNGMTSEGLKYFYEFTFSLL